MSFIYDMENWKEVSELIPKLQSAVIQSLQKHLDNQFSVAEITRLDLIERFREKDPLKSLVMKEMKTLSTGFKVFQGKYTFEIIFILSGFKFAFFNELKHALGNITSSALSNRLRILNDSGIVQRIVHRETPIRVSYQLTEHGWGVYGLLLPLIAYTASIIGTTLK